MRWILVYLLLGVLTQCLFYGHPVGWFSITMVPFHILLWLPLLALHAMIWAFLLAFWVFWILVCLIVFLVVATFFVLGVRDALVYFGPLKRFLRRRS